MRPHSETRISVNLPKAEVYEFIKQTLGKISDIENYQWDGNSIITARTCVSMKTQGDDIYIEVSECEGGETSIYIQSSTQGQVTDWGRNKVNVLNIANPLLTYAHEQLNNTIGDKTTESTSEVTHKLNALPEVTGTSPILGAIVGVLVIVVGLGLLFFMTEGGSSSSSSHSSGFSCEKDVIAVIDGSTVSTPLGSLYFSNGQAYSDGERVSGIWVENLTKSEATICISSPYGGTLYKWRVTPKGELYRLN